MRFPRAFLAALALDVAAFAPPAGAAEPGGKAADQAVIEPLFDSARGLGRGWLDYGWSPHELLKGAPARLDLSGYGGLILAKPDLDGEYGGLAFSYRAPADHRDFWEIRLETLSGQALARVRPIGGRGAAEPGGFVRLFLPMRELNPLGKRFQRVVFHAFRKVGQERVELDRVGLTAPILPKRQASRLGRFAVDCRAPARPISPLIYGIGTSFSDDSAHQWATGATARRWGGNLASRYNWELGNAWNLASDWFFRNAPVSRRAGFGWADFLEENRARGVKSALVVPMLGWVAKDTTSYSFPVSTFGVQSATAPELPDAGNGLRRNGVAIPPGPPTDTSAPSTPESIERWVRRIREAEKGRGRSVHAYILDNEPMLWHQTHRDVHPDPATYDELLEKTVAYASAVRRADPEATLAGPAEWGWLAYHHSARDISVGIRLRPDRRLHGDVPLIPWYLKKLRERERQTGIRLLDVLDVHFYPMGAEVGGPNGGTDPATAALRVRSTRSLWDPTYVDESWINEKMRVLPLLRQWVDENAPGLGISLGEWNFGAERHVSGGLATAEALGRFGTEGLTSAFYWTYPADKSPAFWAFRAYRNFDGAGGRFLDWSVRVEGSDGTASLFASRDERQKKVVAVLLNLDPERPLDARVDLSSCGKVAAARVFTYAGGPSGFAPLRAALAAGAVEPSVAPSSITVVEASLAP